MSKPPNQLTIRLNHQAARGLAEIVEKTGFSRESLLSLGLADQYERFAEVDPEDNPFDDELSIIELDARCA